MEDSDVVAPACHSSTTQIGSAETHEFPPSTRDGPLPTGEGRACEPDGTKAVVPGSEANETPNTLKGARFAIVHACILMGFFFVGYVMRLRDASSISGGLMVPLRTRAV